MSRASRIIPKHWEQTPLIGGRVRAFEQMSEEVVAIFEQQPFRLPPQMMFVLKITLGAIANSA
jgi:hypothetical protein